MHVLDETIISGSAAASHVYCNRALVLLQQRPPAKQAALQDSTCAIACDQANCKVSSDHAVRPFNCNEIAKQLWFPWWLQHAQCPAVFFCCAKQTDNALTVLPANYQAWYRRACSHEALQNYSAACSDAAMAVQLSRSASAAPLPCCDAAFELTAMIQHDLTVMLHIKDL